MKRRIWFIIPFGIGLIIFLGISLLIFPKEDKCLKIAAGLPGGDSYLFAEKMKSLVDENSSEQEFDLTTFLWSRGSKICLTVLNNPAPPQGTEENLQKLENNDAQLATAQADILVMKDLPTLWSEKSKRVVLDSVAPLKQAQVVTLLFPDMYQLIVRADSNVTNVSDLKNRSVAMPPQKGGQIKSFAFLMQHYGLITKDQQLVRLVEIDEKNGDIKKALCEEKKVDAVFYVRAMGNQKIRELLTDEKCQVRLVSIDQAAAIKIQNPYLEETEIPKGAYRGGENPIPNNGPDNIPDYQKQKMKTVSVQRLLLAHKDVPTKVIHLLTKILYEHQQELVKEMPLAANMSPPNNFEGIGLPIHEGAQVYYDREKPSWWEQNSGVIEIIITLIVSFAIPVVSWIWLRLKQREQRRKNKADDYIREVTVLMDASDGVQAVIEYLNAKESNDTDKLKKLSDVITEKAAKILVVKRIAQLDHSDKLISNDSLKSFSKTWRKVVNAIEKIPENASEEIFHGIPQKAIEILDKSDKRRLHNQFRQKRLHNQLLSLIHGWWQKFFGSISLDELQKIENEKLKANLNETLQNALAPKDTRQTLQEPSQLSQFKESESLEIWRDLDAIFKRAVNALVEERISQESFQSFRVVWQIAVGDVDQDSQGGT
ncbi:TAXI family TRAP transporter solute-binding subunit [Mastigocladopsis repens]|uniref:TAXI family TRAP transporter solute-binding subunit n=1 Tax=Mastigocladopsis repens TaxID=221287 RepID=UPI0002F52D43|nr:TAXI family TRAP transporter solute-binding subunit [Mastigocladopsis repens]